jgi:hypothetical protein
MNSSAARHTDQSSARPTARAPPRASSTSVEMPSKPRKFSVATDSALKNHRRAERVGAEQRCGR